MKIENDIKLDFSDVLIRPKRSTLVSRKQVELNRNFKFPSGLTWEGVPIIASNMEGVGTFSMAKSLEPYYMLCGINKFYSVQEWITNYENSLVNGYLHCENLVYTLGMTHDPYQEISKATDILKICTNVKFICIDVANGYTEKFVDYVKRIRQLFPNKIIIAGNVVTPEMTEALVLAGADIVKVGIGSGSVCTTRKVAGVGYPQLSAIIECADAAHGLRAHVLADGGCTIPGDVAKAFGGGADFVMLGGMLAGHDESEMNSLQDENGNIKIPFYGMSSKSCMDKHFGGVAQYRAAEGKTVYLDAKGPVKETIQQILGGVRSACTYVGARHLKDLPKCCTFIRVNRQLNTVYGDSL
jgi:GMP reductase